MKILKDLKTQDYRDSVRARAMNRWYLIVSAAPEASEVGRLLITALGKLNTNEEVREFFEDI